MGTADRRGAIKIGDGTRELQNAVEATGGKIEPLRGVTQQSHAADIRPRRLLDD